MGFRLTSSAFADGAPIPTEHTCDGADRPPRLSWADPPDGTVEFALIIDDSDARGLVHWVVTGIPASSTGLTGRLPDGAREGANDFRGESYGGPCPPENHTYVTTLYALSGPLELGGAATAEDVRRAAAGRTLATAMLRGTYGPRRR